MSNLLIRLRHRWIALQDGQGCPRKEVGGRENVGVPRYCRIYRD